MFTIKITKLPPDVWIMLLIYVKTDFETRFRKPHINILTTPFHVGLGIEMSQYFLLYEVKTTTIIRSHFPFICLCFPFNQSYFVF